MPTTITTVSVRPERAEALRAYRDEHNHRSLDAALDELLNERGE
jgi:hypothetical protein